MLNTYISEVQTLLHDPQAQFFPVEELTTFINSARQQVALEGECIRGVGQFATSVPDILYQNSLVTAPSTPAGIASGGLIVPRTLSFNRGTGAYNAMPAAVLEKRNWDWFQFYWLGMAAPPPGLPAAWCPYDQGINGSFYIAPVPIGVFNLFVDGSWSPIELAADTDPEAIPYPWQDAVQFYAAFLALLDSQRRDDADAMLETYELYMERARGGVTPLNEQRSYPGGLAARQPRGMAPPTPPTIAGPPARGGGG